MIPVLVPWRSDHGYRAQLWQHLQANYWDQLDNYVVVQGQSPGGPFNRSAAINHAAELASDWDVAVIADADTWVPSDQLSEAVTVALSSGRLTAAFTQVAELADRTTSRILLNDLDITHSTDYAVDQIRTEPLCIQSSMLAVPRELWDITGGFDPAFVGWSAEDNAFWKACAVFGGTPNRVPGNAFHLWHPPAPRDGRDTNYVRNQKRWRRYRLANTPQAIRAVRAS